MLFPSFFRSSKKPLTTEKRTVLNDVSWQKFETLLAELGEQRQARLTYFRGRLELMTPIAAHERCNKLIESLILILVEEMHLSVTHLMPVLLKSPELVCATEPDACYYFHNVPSVQGRTELNLPRDPSPDLLVEIALTKSSLDKQPIYATLGIPEVWRYITTPDEDILRGTLLIYELQGDRYVEQQTSQFFPFLSASRALQFLQESDSMSLAASIRLLRSWIKERA
ncbi:MAG: Uma2 family endonuclease [Oscillatoriophycideae cyanobacterium NC_groundwater_1537_Pr4_S-0.65um_50_18]|nr:Uma2 family endonuclease [Oscillatoriophycideae cyanobacterium NC_groundwater_1537_Pr4_S-0.65um_50_18]